MKFNSNSTSESLCRELRKNFRASARSYDELLRKAVSILTTGQDVRISVPRTLEELKILSCISWYLDDRLGILLRFKIQEQIPHFDEEGQIRLSLLLNSEPEMIIYILESDILGKNPNEVFGNIRAKQPRIKVQPNIPRKPKRLIRHRGYRDKGSLRLGSEYLTEERKDFTATEEQNLIEEKREEIQDTIDFNFGFIQ